MPFLIGGPLEPSLYLQPFSRYSASTHVNELYEHTNEHTHTHTHTDTLTNKHDESQYLLAEVITIDSMSNFEMIVNAKTRVFSEE